MGAKGRPLSADDGNFYIAWHACMVDVRGLVNGAGQGAFIR